MYLVDQHHVEKTLGIDLFNAIRKKAIKMTLRR